MVITGRVLQWRAVARELFGVIRIGAVNCEDDWVLCRQKGIHSYPTLVLYPEVSFIANRTCNMTVTGSCCICYSQIWHDPVIFPVIGLSVLCAANQNA